MIIVVGGEFVAAVGCQAIRVSFCSKFDSVLNNGIPSHDTFARVFAQINPQQFQSCFLDWMKSIQKITEDEVVAIDGKTLRGSYG